MNPPTAPGISLALLLLVPGTALSAEGATLDCGASNIAIELPRAGSPVVLTIAPNASGWLELHERGVSIEAADVTGGERFRIGQPLRFGTVVLAVKGGASVEVRHDSGTEAAASTRVSLQCEPTPAAVQRVDWLRSLAGIDAALESEGDAKDALRNVEHVRVVQGTAPDAATRALATHELALALDTAGQYDDAVAMFRSAESQWEALGEPEKRLAARVGRVDAERSGGHWEQVLSDTEDIAERDVEVYFLSRLRNERCVVLDERGRYDAASACFTRTLAELARMQEWAEYASTLRNAANVARKLGQLERAGSMAQEGLRIARGPFAAMAKGRLHLLLSTLARQQGAAAEAFHELGLADAEFRHAGSGGLFWRAALLVDQAVMFEQIGSYSEAYAALGAVAELAPAQQSLGVRALVFAQVEADTGHTDSAAFWVARAEEAFAQAQQHPARATAKLLRLRLMLNAGRVAEVEQALADESDAMPVYASQRQLLATDVALQRGDLPDAATKLAAAGKGAQSLGDHIGYAESQARYLLLRQGKAAALQSLQRERLGLQAVAEQSNSRVTQYLLLKHFGSLEKAAASLVLNDADLAQSALPGTLWHLMMLNELPPARASLPKGDGSPQFDAAIVAELLASPLRPVAAMESNAQRALLAVLGKPGENPSSAARPGPALTSLQRGLCDGCAFLAYLEGEYKGGLLWVSNREIALRGGPPPGAVQAEAEALRRLLASPESSTTDIDAQARRLSTQLFEPLQTRTPPKRLLVLAGGRLDVIAWCVLHWPGREDTLLSTTDVELVHVRATDSQQSVPSPVRSVRVAIAAQGAALPALPNADVEASLIRSALPTAKYTINEARSATRQDLLMHLSEPQTWLHVAAHGTAQPQRIGYAGLWLDPATAGDAPDFLSWIDVLESGAKADLVVLDACRLGEGGGAADRNLSFADALVRAGAHHVVASMWSTSDAASAIWVPAFYAALDADPAHDPAHAVRAAQIRLRESRAFAHPFYWSSLQTISALPVAP